ncbi:hypothetical protein Gotur_027300 [Gossypium turneri]
MAVDQDLTPTLSWKDKLLGGGSAISGKASDRSNGESKEMETTVVLKLLGQSIGYAALHNRISSLWKPVKPFYVMGIENEYFLVKFQTTEDYDRVLTQGPWIIYGQYLTVQPWTKDFSLSQPYSSVVMAWIRLLGLPGFMYKRKIIEAIGDLNWERGKKSEVTYQGEMGLE